MVNRGFPAARSYGFELVDAATLFPLGAVNRKFTENQMKRIFREVSPN